MPELSAGFRHESKEPHFTDDQFATKADLKAYPEYKIPEGRITFCLEDMQNYQWKSTNPDTAETGKWAVFSSGGGGGVSDYDKLTNKPQIEGVELASGNNTLEDLELISADEGNAIIFGSDKKFYTKNLQPQIDELRVYEFPKATIVGNPMINHGQISGFSQNDYLRFPFIVGFEGRPFIINTEFTTGANVTNQQNIFDSDFGFAFAVRNSRFVIAMSSNGQTWDLGESVGTYVVQPNTTYKVRLSWDTQTYRVEFSTNGGETYITDISKASTASLYPTQIYIGVGMNHGTVLNHFLGSINFNYCSLYIGNELVWQGMDDLGRLNVDVSNISPDGEEKIRDIVGIYQKQDVYSTEEKIVGCWTDGKPIYSKTFKGLSVPVTTSGSYQRVIDIPDSDLLIDYRASMRSGGDVLTVLKFGDSRIFNNNFQISFSPYNTTLRELTVWYTKTTDAPGSYKAPAVTNTMNVTVGAIVPFAVDTIPDDFLICDGKEYLIEQYKGLFRVIGNKFGGDGVTTFKVPDLRESVLVGAGENTTNIIADHDVYDVGEFKDDQMQSHTHGIRFYNGNGNTGGNPYGSLSQGPFNVNSNTNSGRTGTTTHGKQTGVIYCIKCRADVINTTLDPDGGLVATDNGLAVKKATTEQYGLIKLEEWEDITDQCSIREGVVWQTPSDALKVLKKDNMISIHCYPLIRWDGETEYEEIFQFNNIRPHNVHRQFYMLSGMVAGMGAVLDTNGVFKIYKSDLFNFLQKGVTYAAYIDSIILI